MGVQALRGFADKSRFSMSQRCLTVSTVGLVGNMRRLMEDMPQIKLALSLHAPNQELREQIVPVAKNYSESLMSVLDEYAVKTVSDGKRKGMVMVSYVLLDGVNDSD